MSNRFLRSFGLVALLLLLHELVLSAVPLSFPLAVANERDIFDEKCVCIEDVSKEGCYSSLWDALKQLDKSGLNEYGVPVTLYVEGHCLGSHRLLYPKGRNIECNLRILMNATGKPSAILYFSSVVGIRVLGSLYVGPGVVFQTPKRYSAVNKWYIKQHRTWLNYVGLFVGSRSRSITAGDLHSSLKLDTARLHGRFTIFLEQLSSFRGTKTLFSGRPRITTTSRANSINDTLVFRPLDIKLVKSNFTREFEAQRANGVIIAIGCTIKPTVTLRKCSFPDPRDRSISIRVCACGGDYIFRDVSFGLKTTMSHISLARVYPCLNLANNSRRLGHSLRQGRMHFYGISFLNQAESDPGRQVYPQSFDRIHVELSKDSPHLTIDSTDYTGMQGYDGQSLVDGHAFTVKMTDEYNGKFRRNVRKTYASMKYNTSDHGALLFCHVSGTEFRKHRIFSLMNSDMFDWAYSSPRGIQFKCKRGKGTSKALFRHEPDTAVASTSESPNGVVMSERLDSPILSDKATVENQAPYFVEDGDVVHRGDDDMPFDIVYGTCTSACAHMTDMMPVREAKVNDYDALYTIEQRQKIFARLVGHYESYRKNHLTAFETLLSGMETQVAGIANGTIILPTSQGEEGEDILRIMNATEDKFMEYRSKYLFPDFDFSKEAIQEAVKRTAVDCGMVASLPDRYTSASRHSIGKFCIRNFAKENVAFYICNGATSGSEPVSDSYNYKQVFMASNPLIEVFGFKGDTNKPVMLYQDPNDNKVFKMKILYAS